MKKTNENSISTLGFTDMFWCIFLGIGIICCIVWIYMTRFKDQTLNLTIPSNVQEERVALNGIKESKFAVMCAHQKELVDDHDYLVFYPINGNMLTGRFVHDPECNKCKGIINEKKRISSRN